MRKKRRSITYSNQCSKAKKSLQNSTTSTINNKNRKKIKLNKICTPEPHAIRETIHDVCEYAHIKKNWSSAGIKKQQRKKEWEKYQYDYSQNNRFVLRAIVCQWFLFCCWYFLLSFHFNMFPLLLFHFVTFASFVHFLSVKLFLLIFLFKNGSSSIYGKHTKSKRWHDCIREHASNTKRSNKKMSEDNVRLFSLIMCFF